MPSGFIYKTGPHDFENVKSTASTAIARGDPLKTSSGALLPLTTGTKCEGVSQSVKAVGDSATTAIQVLRFITGRTRFQAYEKRASGSLAATNLKERYDVSGASGATGFDTSSTSKKEIYLDVVEAIGAINVGRARVCFADPTYVTAASL